MKNRTAFFFYYSLVTVTVLTVGVFLIAPIPYNFFLALIFGPIAGYLWLSASQMQPVKSQEHATHPASLEALKQAPTPLGRQKIKARLIYTVIIIVFTSFVTFFMLTILKNLSETSLKQVLGIQTQTSSDLQKLKEELKTLQAAKESQVIVLQEIQQLRQDLAQLQAEYKVDTSLLFPTINLSPSPTPTPKPLTGFITINSSQWQSVDVLQDKVPSSKVIGQATFGKTYEFLKKEQEYYYIVLSSSIKGWIHAQFVKEVNLNIIQNP